MSFYEDLVKTNVLRPIIRELDSGNMSIDPVTQRIDIKRISIAPRPWLYGAIDVNRFCPIWEQIYFYKYGMIRSSCLGCWKVAYSPPNLIRAFETYDLLLRLGRQLIPGSSHTFKGKVGAERRPHSGNQGGYTAMFYNPLGEDLDFARRLRDILEKRIRSQVDADAQLRLKRGCTEFEQRYAPSDQWDEFYEKYEWKRRERLVDRIVPHYPRGMREQDYAMMQIEVKQLMIEHAFEHGDLTYLKYTDGRPMIAPLVNYAHSDHKSEYFKMGKYTPSNIDAVEVNDDNDRSVNEESQAGSNGSEEQRNSEAEAKSTNIVRLSELE